MRWIQLFILFAQLIDSVTPLPPATFAPKMVSRDTMDVILAIFAVQPDDADRLGDTDDYKKLSGLHSVVNELADIAKISPTETRIGIAVISDKSIEIIISLNDSSTGPGAIKNAVKSIVGIKPAKIAASIPDTINEINEKFKEPEFTAGSQVRNIVIPIIYFPLKTNERFQDWKSAAEAVAQQYHSNGADVVIVAQGFTVGSVMIITTSTQVDNGDMNDEGGKMLQAAIQALVDSCTSNIHEQPCKRDQQQKACIREISYVPDGQQQNDTYCVQGTIRQPCHKDQCEQHTAAVTDTLSNTSAIIGGVCGGVFLLTVVICLVMWYIIKSKKADIAPPPVSGAKPPGAAPANKKSRPAALEFPFLANQFGRPRTWSKIN